jgi:hypothetical protein
LTIAVAIMPQMLRGHLKGIAFNGIAQPEPFLKGAKLPA